MTMWTFLPNGGMTTEPGPEDCAIGVAGTVEAGPPGLNAGGADELQATRPEQIRAVQMRAARLAAMRVIAARASAARAGAGGAAGRWRWVMRLMSSRRGGA